MVRMGIHNGTHWYFINSMRKKAQINVATCLVSSRNLWQHQTECGIFHDFPLPCSIVGWEAHGTWQSGDTIWYFNIFHGGKNHWSWGYNEDMYNIWGVPQMGIPPVFIHFNGILPCKPSSFGYLYGKSQIFILKSLPQVPGPGPRALKLRSRPKLTLVIPMSAWESHDQCDSGRQDSHVFFALDPHLVGFTSQNSDQSWLHFIWGKMMESSSNREWIIIYNTVIYFTAKQPSGQILQ